MQTRFILQWFTIFKLLCYCLCIRTCTLASWFPNAKACVAYACITLLGISYSQ